MVEPVKIIAEAEINHNGDVELAKKMVAAARRCQADFVKFQCFVADSFIAPGSSFLPIFKQAELGFEDFVAIRDHAKKIGITMISTASDLDGLRMIVDLGLPIIKIGSTNITNFPLLKSVAETGKPVYLSTGATTLGEIETALNIVAQGTSDVTLFHCTALYPAADHLLNLRAITTMQAAFPGISIGYSDHSIGTVAAVAAVALGAQVLEKHFTLDHQLPGPDHHFSADPVALAAYVDAVRIAERMLGSPAKRPVKEERAVRLSGRRYVTAMCDIPKGTVIEPKMVRSRRIDVSNVDTANILGPEFENAVAGWRARHRIPSGSAFTWTDLEAGS